MQRYLPLALAALFAALLFQQNIIAPQELLMLAVLGGLAGIFAGLFGIGGGTVVVPGLVYVFTQMGIPQDIIMHMALGTSLAVIIPASLAAMRAQLAKGTVRLDFVRRMSPGLVLGSLMGASIAHFIPTHQLMLIFSGFLLFVSFNVFWGGRKKVTAPVTERPSPSWVFGIATGLVVGMVSALLGIGGGTLLVPTLLGFGLAMHAAVGTSSAMGSIIALPGAIGYVLSGADVASRPEFSLGYVSLSAMLVLAPLATFAAPYGVRLSHHLPVRVLKMLFAAFLALIALKMLWKAIG